MIKLRTAFTAGFLAATLSMLPAAIAEAETVLQLDEVAVGEMDPAKASDTADSILMFNLYDTLVLPKQGDVGYVPHLAKSWSQDGNTLTFNLRKDATFQSGNPLTAADVVFSLKRMQAIGAGLSYLFEVVEKVEAVDEHTVKFTLKQPYSPFIASLIRLPILDKTLVMKHLGEGEGEMGDWGQEFLSGHAAGTGAYSVVSHNPQSETVMQKNEDYFLGIPDAAPDSVRLRYSLEPATVRTLLAQNKHDIGSQWLPPEVIKSLAEGGAQLLTEGGTGGLYLKMNTTKPPLDDVNCRKALSYAFDYSTALRMVAITNEVSMGRPATGAIPVGMLGANDKDQIQKQDMEKAKEYLAACKYDPAEMNIEISWIAEVPIEERFALLFQSNLNQLGIKSEIHKMPWALFTEAVAKPENTPHVSQLFVDTITGDPDTLLYGMYHSSSAGTWQSPEYLNDEKVDQYLEAGRTATTVEAREAAYSKLNDRLMELAPTIYAYDQQAVFPASNRISVTALSDKEKAFGVDSLGFSFRLMEIKE